jgi:hypothetical protein
LRDMKLIFSAAFNLRIAAFVSAALFITSPIWMNVDFMEIVLSCPAGQVFL